MFLRGSVTGRQARCAARKLLIRGGRSSRSDAAGRHQRGCGEGDGTDGPRVCGCSAPCTGCPTRIVRMRQRARNMVERSREHAKHWRVRLPPSELASPAVRQRQVLPRPRSVSGRAILFAPSLTRLYPGCLTVLFFFGAGQFHHRVDDVVQRVAIIPPRRRHLLRSPSVQGVARAPGGSRSEAERDRERASDVMPSLPR